MNALFAAHSIYVELPIVIMLVSVVYSATRYDRWDLILRESLRWALRMGLFLVGIVLILSGISMQDKSMLMRSVISGAGIALEVSLLFIK